MKKRSALSAICLGILLSAAFTAAARAEIRSFQEVAVEIGGAKFWFPSSITVKKGDVVKIHAVSKIPGMQKDTFSVHGFAVEDFQVMEVVDDKGKDFEFTATKAGIFPIRCQLHPAHIGGQLIVLE